MFPLTNRQREILKKILDVGKPISSVELAGLLHLTPRQVSYSMRGVKKWLKQHNQDLETLPGVGYDLNTSPEQAQALYQEISSHTGSHIILSVSQRQQLLALFLLTKSDPFILSQLEQILQVSRMTVSKDLDQIESWLQEKQIILIRKPHFGIQVSGNEQSLQQALAEVIWCETPFSSDPVITITHATGLVFSLKDSDRLLPIIKHVNNFLTQIDIRRTIDLVAKAEELLGGRFTDDAVLNLALVFAIMSNRVQGDHHLKIGDQSINNLKTMAIWPVATYVANRLGRDSISLWQSSDVAGIAMEMLAAPRDETLPGELERNGHFSVLIEQLMEYISQAFTISKLEHDQTLQNGLMNYIVPACFRQRFNLRFPVSLNVNIASLPERYEREFSIAQGIARIVSEQVDVELPQSEISIIVMLLRAAYIRNRPYLEHIIIVCPSGMATAQLLAARLHARFPNLKSLEVVSLRNLTSSLLLATDLILTTVPLPEQFAVSSKVIQVHPLLMPEDIEAITQFLS